MQEGKVNIFHKTDIVASTLDLLVWMMQFALGYSFLFHLAAKSIRYFLQSIEFVKFHF